MKKYVIAAIIFAAVLSACGKSEKTVPARSGDFLIPESAALIGYVDMSGLMQHNQIRTIKVTAEEQLGIKLDQADEIFFWVSYDGLEGSEPAWCIASKAKAITDISAAFEEDGEIDGFATYTLKNEEGFRAVIISGYAVVGTDAGVAMSIHASKGGNLPQSPRNQLFSQMISKIRGALTIAFVPTPEIKAKMSGKNMDDEFAPLLENCAGISIAADYKDEKLLIAVVVDSSKEAAETAAAEILKLKEDAKPYIDQFGAILGEQPLSLLKICHASFTAKAFDGTLRLSLEIPGKLLEIMENFVSNMR